MKTIVRIFHQQWTDTEIELPLFRKQDCTPDFTSGTYTVFSREHQENDGTLTSTVIHLHDGSDGINEVWFEVKKDYKFNARDSADYILGRNEYACTKEEFLQALKVAKEFVEAIDDGEHVKQT